MTQRIEHKEISHDDGYDQWRCKSLPVLPSGVFVWKDEFEACFWSAYGPHGEIEWIPVEGGFRMQNKKEFIELDFEPLALPEFLDIAMEGFEPQTTTPSPAPVPQAAPVRTVGPSGEDSLEFIRLATVVARIADCVQLEPHLDDSATAIGDISRAAADKFWKENNPKIEWARSFGVAASMLNKALHDSNMPPQWMEFDKQKRFAVKNDTVKQEGVELLTHATGWGNREQGNYSIHFFNAITQGEDALAMPIARGLNDGQAPDGKMLRFLNIGFDRAELVAFLDKKQIDHSLTPSPAPETQAAPVMAVSAFDKDGFSKILAMAGMAVLNIKVAQAEATNHLENSPAAMKMLNRLMELQEKRELKNQAPEPQATTSPAPVPQATPVGAVIASSGVVTDKAGPVPVETGLPTKYIADAFDGVNDWGADRWPRNLSASKWLHPARIAIGQAGGASSLWNPVMLAQLMHDKAKGEREKEKLMKVLNSRFTLIPTLGPWRDAFNEYFATHCTTD